MTGCMHWSRSKRFKEPHRPLFYFPTMHDKYLKLFVILNPGESPVKDLCKDSSAASWLQNDNH
jgi:hypothetical protein